MLLVIALALLVTCGQFTASFAQFGEFVEQEFDYPPTNQIEPFKGHWHSSALSPEQIAELVQERNQNFYNMHFGSKRMSSSRSSSGGKTSSQLSQLLHALAAGSERRAARGGH